MKDCDKEVRKRIFWLSYGLRSFSRGFKTQFPKCPLRRTMLSLRLVDRESSRCRRKFTGSGHKCWWDNSLEIVLFLTWVSLKWRCPILISWKWKAIRNRYFGNWFKPPVNKTAGLFKMHSCVIHTYSIQHPERVSEISGFVEATVGYHCWTSGIKKRKYYLLWQKWLNKWWRNSLQLLLYTNIKKRKTLAREMAVG